LIGETEQIIKHDIAPEDYKMLMDLINIEPEIGLNIVDENIVRVTDHIPIMPNENGDYLKYLVLHDSVLNRIPLLVRIELLVDDLGKKEPILSSIQKSHIEFFGVTSMEVIGEFSDGNYYWEKMFDLSNDEAISTLSSDRMAEVMYLDANYSEVKLWDIFDDVVTYSSSYSINNYKVSIGIGRDPITEELYLNVRDESD
jgi:hypothetical protein